MEKLSSTFLDSLGRNRGWVDYPTDSIEQGSVWHCDPEKAPFGRTRDKESFNGWVQSVYETLQLYPELVEEFLRREK